LAEPLDQWQNRQQLSHTHGMNPNSIACVKTRWGGHETQALPETGEIFPMQQPLEQKVGQTQNNYKSEKRTIN
jgi:hypothetical protein